MSNDVSTKISDYLGSHRYLNLATIGPDGRPVAHTVGYAAEGTTVYFMTDKKSRKARNIGVNPAVAFTVDEDYTDLSKIQGVQMKGKAEPVTDKAVIDRIVEKMVAKFSQIAQMPKNPDYVFFRIVPEEAYFIDNSLGFGHRDEWKKGS